MATKDMAWHLTDDTLHLKGAWLRTHVAKVLPQLPTKGIHCIDMHAVTQVDSALMTILLAVRGEAPTLLLRGVSADVAALLTLYRLTPFFTQEAV